MAGLAVFVRKRRRSAAEKAPEFAAGEYGDSELMCASLAFFLGKRRRSAAETESRLAEGKCADLICA
jgi:hypothetical protein